MRGSISAWVGALCLAGLTACGDDDGSHYPDAGGGAPVTRDEAERFCAVAGACVDGVSDCFSDVLPYAGAALIRCALYATDCAGFWACQGFDTTPVSSCEPACDGDVLVDCEGGTLRTETDCSQRSETCVMGSGGPACGIEPCSEASASCDGNVLVRCDLQGGVKTLTFCDQFGWSCVEDGTNLARCSDGTDVDCTAGTAPRCEGSRLVSCVAGKELGIECAGIVEGMACYLLGTHSYCGFGAECDPITSKGMETCAGTVMTYCAAGVNDTLDCAEFAFTMCVASATFGGRCTNTL